jgi:hypothetical protein
MCVKILKQLKVQLQTFHGNDLKLRLDTRLFHKIDKTLFIIFYNHYLSKISELENQVPKLRF